MVKTTDFIGNFVYENNYPVYNSFDEGRIIYRSNGTYFAETYIKDHLGNIRVAFGNEGNESQFGIRQVNAYYPFGMNINSLTANKLSNYKKNEYLYNGKMFQDELGLDWLDYGARFYDAVIGRWHTLDAYSEKYYSLSPNQYAANNPINVIDINGDSTYLVIYGAGYTNYHNQGQLHDVGDGFKKNAETLAESIRNREGYDPERDAVVLVEAKSTEQFIAATNTEYNSGKIAEMTVFSHGYPEGVSLGGQSPNDVGVSQEQADAQLAYDKREINSNTMKNIDRENFESNARSTFYGCEIGGYKEKSASSSFGQSFADYMGESRTVRAFTGKSEFTTSGGNGKNVTYTGRMIRSVDRSSQITRLTTFNKNRGPKIP